MLKTFWNVNKHMWYKKYLWLNLGYLGITKKFQNVLNVTLKMLKTCVYNSWS